MRGDAAFVPALNALGEGLLAAGLFLGGGRLDEQGGGAEENREGEDSFHGDDRRELTFIY